MKNLYFRALGKVFSIVKSRYKRRTFTVILLSILNSIIEIFGLAFVIPVIYLINDPQLIFDNRILHTAYDFLDCQNVNQFILWMMLGLVVIFLIKNAGSIYINYLQNRFAYSISYDLLKRQFTNFFYTDINKYIAKNPSYIVRDIAIAPHGFAINIFLPLVVISNELFILVFILIGLLIFNFKILLLLMLTILPIIYLTMRYTKNKAFQISEEKNIAEPESYKRVYDNVNSFLDIKSFGKESLFVNNATIPYKKLFGLYTRSMVYKSIPQKLMEIVVVIAITIVFIIYVYFLAGSPNMLVPILAMFATAAYRIMPSADRIMRMMLEIQTSEYVLDVLLDQKEEKPVITDSLVSVKHFNSELRLENASYSFGNNGRVLNEVNLQIGKGEKIGIIGESGSGKTTIARIIVGLIRTFEGKLFIDGEQVDPKEKSWNLLSSVVQQDFLLLNQSLAENIAFGVPREEIDESQIIDTIHKVQLDELLEQMPEGIWTEIKENGKNLSGGQRQRVAIARAIYHNCQILVLDEATSALDLDTEAHILKMIDGISSRNNITTIIISHKKSALSYCDKIYEVKKGSVVGKYGYEQYAALSAERNQS